MIRRVVGVALGAFMLHLNVQRADLVCATHTHEAPPSEHAQHGSHDPAHSADHDEGTSTGERCHVPAQADCCLALTSCALMPALDAEQTLLTELLQQSNLFVAQSQPASRHGGPEPPPPRA